MWVRPRRKKLVNRTRSTSSTGVILNPQQNAAASDTHHRRPPRETGSGEALDQNGAATAVTAGCEAGTQLPGLTLSRCLVASACALPRLGAEKDFVGGSA